MIFMPERAERTCELCGAEIFPYDWFWLGKEGFAVCEDCVDNLTAKELIEQLGFKNVEETRSEGSWYDG